MTPLDPAWLRANPLPPVADGTDKNDRGRVLLAGGSLTVPGALRLTAEAAFRAGAGKVQMATVAEATLALGMTMPEGAVFPLPANEDGELAEGAGERLAALTGRADCLILGPGMGQKAASAAIVSRVLADAEPSLAVLLDAAALSCAGEVLDAIRDHAGAMVLTPHHGEMAACSGCDEDAVKADPEGAARAAAQRFDSVVALKSGETIIAAPDGRVLHYAGGGAGLATGGSGDVLAGIVGGLLARGISAFEAAAWGVWLHGEAGRRLAERGGTLGLLARELPALVPRLMG